ncbi:hypothetical protein CANINC_003216 [Pichia inconspicua]|uniref:Uncharacterized protein n=1 Tax=Pichia inconspicua TaxID=52247 RepID=A0A4T0WZ90_9ASCO|nr:hypothetical protein CANINC_003216 [[Candida] inconspicua]
MTHTIDVLSAKLKQDWKWWNYGNQYDGIQKECEDALLAIGETRSTTTAEYALIFYFDKRSLAPWITSKSRELAKSYIESCSDVMEIAEAVAERTLLAYKKLGITTEVTPSGHRSISHIKIRENLIGKSYTSSLDKREQFKKDFITSIGSLNYLIAKSENIEQSWKYILPLLLVFLEDSDMMVKREAALSLNNLLERLESGTNILIKSQVMPLLINAIQPLLLAIPSLTPADQTIVILPIAYETIFKIYKIGISKPLERYMALDSLLHDTILPSLTKCKESIPVSETLLKVLQNFLVECDIYATVVAKPIIYTLLTILMDPYVAFAIPIVDGCVEVVTECLLKVKSKDKYKYDLDACIRTLRRRISNLSESTDSKMRELECIAGIQ